MSPPNPNAALHASDDEQVSGFASPGQQVFDSLRHQLLHGLGQIAAQLLHQVLRHALEMRRHRRLKARREQRIDARTQGFQHLRRQRRGEIGPYDGLVFERQRFRRQGGPTGCRYQRVAFDVDDFGERRQRAAVRSHVAAARAW